MKAETTPRRWRERLADRLATPWAPASDRPRAYFVYAHARTTEIDGALSCPPVDAVMLADDSAPQGYQVGHLAQRVHVSARELPYRLGLADLCAAVLSCSTEWGAEYRFIREISSGVDRRFLPGGIRWLWNVRNLLIAEAIAHRTSRLAWTHQVAHVSDFYSAFMLGITLAFRRAGKPVWDIQHGRIGPAHQTYNRAVFSIACGFRPTGLIVWDAPTGEYVGEALGVEWRSTEYAHLGLGSEKPSDGRCAILFTLQVDTPIPPSVRAVIREVSEVTWCLRLHPGGRNPERDYLPLLELPHVVLSSARTPLAADLRAASVHVTWNSSVVTEAAALGVPSFFLDAQAAPDFAKEVHAGIAKQVDPEALAAALRRALDARREVP